MKLPLVDAKSFLSFSTCSLIKIERKKSRLLQEKKGSQDMFYVPQEDHMNRLSSQIQRRVEWGGNPKFFPGVHRAVSPRPRSDLVRGLRKMVLVEGEERVWVRSGLDELELAPLLPL